MRSKILATLLLVMTLTSATGVAAAQAPGIVTKPSGVMVIHDDCLAAANTPWGAVSYAASFADH